MKRKSSARRNSADSAFRKAAEKKALLYGVVFDGREPVAKGKIVYWWTDLVTGTSFISDTLDEMPDRLLKARRRFSNPSKAEKLSEAFHGFKPRRRRRVELDFPTAMVSLGRVHRIEYLSDKFDGRLRSYFHDFEGPAALYTSDEPQKDGSTLLIIHGRFKVKAEGITG